MATTPETAQDALNLDWQRGDYIQGNTETRIVATGRTAAEFKANKFSNPTGDNVAEYWDDSRGS